MSYENLYVHQLEAFLQQPNVIVIDIRDIHSYKEAHIKGALHIDGPTMGNLIRQRKNNPHVLVYCYHGRSSRDISKMIVDFGFSNVSHLVGGWEAWANHKILNEKDQTEYHSEFSTAFA